MARHDLHSTHYGDTAQSPLRSHHTCSTGISLLLYILSCPIPFTRHGQPRVRTAGMEPKLQKDSSVSLAEKPCAGSKTKAQGNRRDPVVRVDSLCYERSGNVEQASALCLSWTLSPSLECTSEEPDRPRVWREETSDIHDFTTGAGPAFPSRCVCPGPETEGHAPLNRAVAYTDAWHAGSNQRLVRGE